MNRRRREPGQVLIISLMVCMVILVCILVIFNLFIIIRGRMKTETAEQAAALTAAEWQRESLNLIGEINLIKATRSLLELDAPPPEMTEDGSDYVDEVRDRITPRVKTLTEMQSRLAFVGPLIGFAAAQQAAKQNGVRAAQGARNINRDLASYHEQLLTSPHYLLQPEIINYYRWRQPYTNLIAALDDGQLAIRPSGRTPGLIRVDPSWLVDEDLYTAIHAENFCHGVLRMLLKKGDDQFFGRWWGDTEFSPGTFPDQSEIYSLDVTFSNASNAAETEAGLMAAQKVDPGRDYWDSDAEELPYLRWCRYDSWWDDIDYLKYAWTGDGRLRADLRKSFLYNGPVAYAETFIDAENLRLLPVRNPDQPLKTWNRENAFIQRDVRLGSNYPDNFDNRYGAAAQVVGAFPSGDNPVLVPIVLPVFKQVARIPVSLKNFVVFQADFSDLYKFLMLLAQLQSLDEADSQYDWYLSALRQLSDPQWRRKGYNPDFSGSLADFPVELLFGTSYRYPANSDGPGWLQAAYVGKDDNPPAEASSGRLYHDQEHRRYYLGNSYVEYDADGNFKTQENEICNYTPGPGPTPGPGEWVPAGPPNVN